MKYFKPKLGLFDDLANVVLEKMHDKQGFDEQCRGYVSQIIDNAIALVVYRLAKDNKLDEDLDRKIRDVNAGLVAFIALFISQLEHFSRGKEDGPLYDLIRKSNATTKDHNDGG